MLKISCLVGFLWAASAAVGGACPAVGQWVDSGGRVVAAADALAKASGAQAVLLGEEHANAAHHRWQSEVIAALAARGPVIIGLEQLPREAQPALDRWVAGETDEAQFLAESRWKERWGHDFAAYRPVFAVAQAKRIPMRGLNVDRAFVRRVGREGFDRAAADGKAPISRPAASDPAYVVRLEESFRQHMRDASPAALARFVEAQTVWDRAMAEAIVHALREQPAARVVAIMGWGHVAFGHGVANQAKDLGVRSVVGAIALDADGDCEPGPAAADLSYGTANTRPR